MPSLLLILKLVRHIETMREQGVNPDHPAPTGFQPLRTIEALGDHFYDPVNAARFPAHILRFRNDKAAQEVGLDTLNDDEWIAHFGAFHPLPGSLPQPLALRYHGHQFRTYNPDIGDGRGFLFAQMRDTVGRTMDLGTKGSGQTPYSRFGDGRLTLKGAVREVLATEMLEALGVRTSRSFSIIETGESLDRNDEPSPTRSAVLVRLSHGHIRYGTFQRLAYQNDAAAMARLVDYTLEHLLDDKAGGAEPAVRLLEHAVQSAARLVASYMAAGFVHGVLNTDNISITSESFDYGPWRFTPRWEADFVAAYFDRTGLYAFGRQPEALYWNLLQLARALAHLSDGEALGEVLNRFPDYYGEALQDTMLTRLGVRRRTPAEDKFLIEAMVRGLTSTDTLIDQLFFDWHGGGHMLSEARKQPYQLPEFSDFTAAIAHYEPLHQRPHPYFSDDAPCSMHIDEVESLFAAIANEDNWQPFHDKIAAIRRMGQALGQH